MRRHILPIFAAVSLLAGCSDLNSLPDATIPNVVIEDITLSALTGTSISSPSGYSVQDNQAVRTDLTSAFDFAFDITAGADGPAPVFLPLAALGLSTNTGIDPGLQRTDLAFDAITAAPSNGYTSDQSVPADSGAVYYVRSRVVCGALGVPQYAKLEITGLDLGARTVTFRVLADNNCGYRGLQPGLPKK